MQFESTLSEQHQQELQMARNRIFGPYLQFHHIDYNSGEWNGSVLVVVPSENATVNLQIQYLDQNAKFDAFQLSEYQGYHFMRTNITGIKMLQHEKVAVNYQINVLPEEQFQFYVPALDQKTIDFMFYSCNGFSAGFSKGEQDDVGGLSCLWKDFMKKHEAEKYCLIVGGGDQVYADDIWSCPSLKEWLHIRGKKHRFSAPWTNKMEAETSKFYFNLYVHHWQNPSLRNALSSVPCLNCLDDHDIFDGVGSYPDYIENSQVLVNLKRVAFYFYRLFQLQTTPEIASDDGYLGTQQGSLSVVRQIGTSTALLLLDARSERSLQKICSTASYEEVFFAVSSLPSNVKQLVVQTGVPIIYPRFEPVYDILTAFQAMKRAANGTYNFFVHKLFGNCVGLVCGQRTKGKLEDKLDIVKRKLGKHGLLHSVINHFGESELADDLNDHWSSKYHVKERGMLIKSLQNISEAKQLRISFIAGDVHLATAGRLYNPHNELDAHYMLQVVSSAICNIPPPKSVGATANKLSKVIVHDETTREEMISMFEQDVDGKTHKGKVMLRRNYLLVGEAENDSLQFTLQVQNDPFSNPSVPYSLVVPPLK